MKKTIELDPSKIENIMKLRGFKTQREAIDFALTHGERIAKALKAFEGDLFTSDSDPIDKEYDLMQVRDLDKPGKSSGSHN